MADRIEIAERAAERFGLTKAQREAIDLERSVAVTAGAGSGKTRALAARYVAEVLSGTPPERILAITFTIKAAAEMRGRIRKALAALAGDGGGGGYGPPTGLADAVEAVHAAPISTIHAFCSTLLREHAVAAALDPSFEVMEAAEARLLFAETRDEMFRELGVARDERLDLLAELWGRTRLARSLDAIAARRWAGCAYAGGVLAATDADLLARWNAASGFDDAAVLAFLARADVQGALVEAGLGDAKGAHDLRCRLRDFLFESCYTADGKDIRKRNLTGAGTRLATAAPHPSRIVGRADEASLPFLRAFASLFLEVLRRFDARKLARNVLDFADLEERALALLRARPEVREGLRRRFRLVLVDEVQDVDELEWGIVEAIVSSDAGRIGEGGAPKLFAVGDEKQSIYRFRGADVSVFRTLRARLEAEGGRLATLDESFRSLGDPLDFSNGLFDRLFGEPAGGYRDFDARPGRLVGRREHPERGGVELLVAVKADIANGGGNGGNGGGNGGASTAEADEGAEPAAEPLGGALPFDQAIDEAELVARWIRTRLDDPAFEVSPPRAGRGEGQAPGRARRFRPGDAAILLRRWRNVKLYEAALRRHGIPFSVHGGVGFYRTAEVLDAANLLAFLADERDDVALAGLLRSPYANLSDAALALIATRGRGETLWDRLVGPSEAHGLAAEDVAAAEDAVAAILRLRDVADRVPLAELLRRALETTGAYAAYAVGPRGAQAHANLAKLLEMARTFEERGFAGLARFVELLDFLIEEEPREGEAGVAGASEAKGGVRILTIHAAKGLEFPVAIVPELGGRLFSEWPTAVFERLPHGCEVGIYAPHPGRRFEPMCTAVRRLLIDRSRAMAEAEHRRILYVACTRARDRLVLVGSARGVRGGCPPLEAYAKIEPPRDTWLAWLFEALGIDRDAVTRAGRVDGPAGAASVSIPIRTRIDLPAAPAETPGPRLLDAMGKATAPGAAAAEPAAARRDELVPPPLEAPPPRPVLSPSRWALLGECARKYHYASVLRIPEWPLAAAAALEGAPSASASASASGAWPSASRALARGWTIHRLLEAERRPSDAELGEEVRRLLGEAGIDDDAFATEVTETARRALASFAASGVGGAVARSTQVFRERSFALSLGDAGDAEGTIDLLFRDAEGEWRIVDFKTNDVEAAEVDAEIERRGYGRQMGLYALAVRRLLAAGGGGQDRTRGDAPLVLPGRVVATLFFTKPGVERDLVFEATDLARVEADLARDLDRIARGDLDRPADAPCFTCGFAASGVCDVATPGARAVAARAPLISRPDRR